MPCTLGCLLALAFCFALFFAPDLALCASTQPIAPEVSNLYNLVENGGFEEGVHTPAWWDRYPAKDADGNRHLLDTTTAHSGQSSGLIWSVTPHEPGKAPFQWNKYHVAVEGGSTLIISYWIKSEGSKPLGAGVHFYDRNGEHLGFKSIPAPADVREWTNIVQDVSVPSAAVKIGLALYAEDLVKTWYDDVAVLGTPSLEAVRGTPKLDGKLDDTCWADDRAVEGFVLHTGAGLASEATRAWVAYDDRCLYVAFNCPYAKGSILKAEATKHDGNTWLDDSIEVFLAPEHRSGNYHQFCVNCRGVIRDSVGQDATWESGAHAATAIGDDAWTVELAIPFENLEVTLDTSGVWGLNLVRNDRVRGEVTTWSLGGFHRPSRFGSVALAPELAAFFRRDLAGRIEEQETVEARLIAEMEASELPREALTLAYSLVDQARGKLAALRAVVAGGDLPEGGWEAVKWSLTSVDGDYTAARRAAIEALFGAEGVGGEGFRVIIANSLQKVRRSGPVSDGAIIRRVRLEAAADEAENFQLVVVPGGGPLKGVAVEAPALTGPGGKIPLQWNVVGYVETAEPLYKTEYVGWWPDPLLPGKPFDVAAGERQPLWFTVEVPPEAKPGLYTGQVTVSERGRSVAIPVELRVRNFRLPRPGTLSTAFGMYLPHLARWWFGNQPHKMPIEAYARWAEFLGQYRLAPKNIARDYVTVTREGDRYKVDLSQLHKTVGKLADTYYAPYSFALCRIDIGDYWWRSARGGSFALVDQDPKVGQLCLRVILQKTDTWADVSRTLRGDDLQHKGCDLIRFWLRAGDEVSAKADLQVYLNCEGARYSTTTPVGSTEWHEVVLPIEQFKNNKTSALFTADTFRTLTSFQFVIGASPNPVTFYVDDITGDGPGGRVSIDDCEHSDEQSARQVANYVRAHAEEWEHQGLPKQVFVYAFDEPSPTDYPFLRLAYQKIRETVPQYPIMQTIGDPSPDALAGLVDIWCPLTQRLDSDFYAERLKAGDALWTYVCCGPRPPYANFFVDEPAVDHRVVFWQARQYGATGFLYWCVTIWDGLPMAHSGEPCFPDVPISLKDHLTYQAFQTNGDGLIAYPGKDMQPLSSVRLEVIRDGIEDYEYLAMLARMVEKARALPVDRRPAKELLEQAEALTQVPESVSRTLTDYTKDPQVLLQRRQEIGDAIEKLTEILGRE